MFRAILGINHSRDFLKFLNIDLGILPQIALPSMWLLVLILTNKNQETKKITTKHKFFQTSYIACPIFVVHLFVTEHSNTYKNVLLLSNAFHHSYYIKTIPLIYTDEILKNFLWRNIIFENVPIICLLTFIKVTLLHQMFHLALWLV